MPHIAFFWPVTSLLSYRDQYPPHTPAPAHKHCIASCVHFRSWTNKRSSPWLKTWHGRLLTSIPACTCTQTLYSFLRSLTQLDKQKVIAMAQDMARAIAYLHTRRPVVVSFCVHTLPYWRSRAQTQSDIGHLAFSQPHACRIGQNQKSIRVYGAYFLILQENCHTHSHIQC